MEHSRIPEKKPVDPAQLLTEYTHLIKAILLFPELISEGAEKNYARTNPTRDVFYEGFLEMNAEMSTSMIYLRDQFVKFAAAERLKSAKKEDRSRLIAMCNQSTYTEDDLRFLTADTREAAKLMTKYIATHQEIIVRVLSSYLEESVMSSAPYLKSINRRMARGFIILDEIKETLKEKLKHKPKDAEEMDKKWNDLEKYKVILSHASLSDSAFEETALSDLSATLSEHNPFREPWGAFIKNPILTEQLLQKRELIGEIQRDLKTDITTFNERNQRSESGQRESTTASKTEKSDKKSLELSKLGHFASHTPVDRNPHEFQIADQQLLFVIKLIEGLRPTVTSPISKELEVLSKSFKMYLDQVRENYDHGTHTIPHDLIPNLTKNVSKLIELTEGNKKTKSDEIRLFQTITDRANKGEIEPEIYGKYLQEMLGRLNISQENLASNMKSRRD